MTHSPLAMDSRRVALKQSFALASLLVSAGLWPRLAQAAWNSNAFDAETVKDVLKAYGYAPPQENKGVQLQAPEVAENGAVVPMTLTSSIPATKSLLLLVEKNPNALVAKFDVTDLIEPSFVVRAKLAQSTDVYAVALTQDGKAYFSKREVTVTLGGCGA